MNTPCASAIVDAAASFVPCGSQCLSTPLCAGASLPSWPGDIRRTLAGRPFTCFAAVDVGVVSTFWLLSVMPL